jgi:membrane-bound lytic murein transglycosylase D
MWQFIRETGGKSGLKADSWVDERFDPEMATRAAARHLRDLYHEFGDWYLAIAAYNCGQGNVDRAVAKTGYADVWELRSRGTLPVETSNYVPIILAMTIMAKNPANYGIENLAVEDPLLYDTVEVNTLTSLALVSDIVGRPVSELKELNPALLREMAPAGYKLHIPRGSGQALMAGLDMVPAERRASWRAHRAQDGDSLALLATRYRTSAASIQAANGGAAEEVNPGSLVIIPAAAPQPVVIRTAKAPVRYAAGKGSRTPAPARAALRKPGTAKPVAKAAAKPVRKQASTATAAGKRRQG